jgi:hypothetical protein
LVVFCKSIGIRRLSEVARRESDSCYRYRYKARLFLSTYRISLHPGLPDSARISPIFQRNYSAFFPRFFPWDSTDHDLIAPSLFQSKSIINRIVISIFIAIIRDDITSRHLNPRSGHMSRFGARLISRVASSRIISVMDMGDETQIETGPVTTEVHDYYTCP